MQFINLCATFIYPVGTVACRSNAEAAFTPATLQLKELVMLNLFQKKLIIDSFC